jgi:DNA-binding NarL/FixJ family response regulator
MDGHWWPPRRRSCPTSSSPISRCLCSTVSRPSARSGRSTVLKTSAGAELLEAIREALSGGVYVTPSIDREVVRAQMERAGRDDVQEDLTPRQREVLQLLAEGKSLKDVAAILKISTKTVEFHKYRVMSKLGLRTNAELTKYAVKLGMTPL